MNTESGFKPDVSNESELQEIRRQIDETAKVLVNFWKEDGGWSLTFVDEENKRQAGFVGQYNEGVKEFNKTTDRNLRREISGELEEKDQKQKNIREKFETIKKNLEQLLTEYYFKIRDTDAVREWKKIFPYADVYKPSYHELKKYLINNKLD